MSVHFFSDITEKSHPAVPYVLAFLEAQTRKNYESLRGCFTPNADSPLFLNLPGGVVMRDPKQLLARHREFYKSPNFQFQSGKLQDGMGNDNFFTCTVLVRVTLPNGTKRTNYIDMTYLKNGGPGPAWIPTRLINTVVDSTR